MLLADSDRSHRRARGERGRQAVDLYLALLIASVAIAYRRSRQEASQHMMGHRATWFTRAMIAYVVQRLDLEAAAADSRELQGSDHSDEPICRVRFFQVDSEHIFMQILPISNPGVKAYSFTFG